MPYIQPGDRDDLLTPMNPGQLNWKITTMIIEYLDRSAMKYADYNEVIGVLECVKQEFYRRAVVPYEKRKIKENGDVY